MTTFVQAVPFEVAGAKATVKQAVPAGGVVHRRTPNSLRITGPQVSSGAGQVLLSSGLLVAAATARPGRRRKLVRQAEAATATSTQTLSETQTKFWEMLQLDLEDVVYPEFGEDNLGRVKQFIKHCTYEEPVPKLPDMQEADPEYFPGLTSSPWWDTAECGEWIEKVKEGLPYVQGELADLLEDNEESMVSDSVKNDVMGGGWSGFRLQRLGDWISKNCDLFPQTVQLLKDAKAPLAMRGVIIARQGPNTGVNSHSDGRNFFLRPTLASAFQMAVMSLLEVRQGPGRKTAPLCSTHRTCTARGIHPKRIALCSSSTFGIPISLMRSGRL